MEASVGMIAGSHKRNKMVLIHHDTEVGSKPLKHSSSQVCQICGDNVGVIAEREPKSGWR
jgi:cellulose synthase A